MQRSLHRRPAIGPSVAAMTLVWLCACDSTNSTDRDAEKSALTQTDFSASSVEAMCRHAIDDTLQRMAPDLYRFAEARPGPGAPQTDCVWHGRDQQVFVAEFISFPHTEVDEGGARVVVTREESQRNHSDGYESRADIADQLGAAGVYTRHLEGYDTILVFGENRAVFMTSLGPVPTSEYQLEMLALSLDGAH